MLVEIIVAQGRCANPTIAGPKSRVLVQAPSNTRTDDTLVETIRVIGKSQMPIEPPFQSAVRTLDLNCLAQKERSTDRYRQRF